MLRRLRPLSENECYFRLYARDEETVRVMRVDRHRPDRASELAISGESLRALFEERLDSREPGAGEDLAA